MSMQGPQQAAGEAIIIHGKAKRLRPRKKITKELMEHKVLSNTISKTGTCIQ